MTFSMTGQDKGDLLIQVTTWAGLTVILYSIITKIAQVPYAGWGMSGFFSIADFPFENHQELKYTVGFNSLSFRLECDRSYMSDPVC